MPKPLVIVESPAKAKTIAGFLGRDVVVESSIGHIRDLPRSAADVPPALKSEPWARLGVDVDNGFKPLYVVAKEKKAQVSKLKSLMRDASEVYLATDEDREGESIAWHLMEVLAPRVPVKRMVFHEITRGAIERAVDWWDLEGRFAKEAQSFSATLVAIDDQRLATGKDFSETGELRTPKGSPGLVRLDEPKARDLAERLADASFAVTSVEEKPFK